MKILVICVLLTIGHVPAYARGAVPPPPPFTGGGIGSGWLNSGPVFGFDEGGGPGGGWGGGWYELGGWGGWGSGSGPGGYGHGGSGNGTGHEFGGDELDGLHGTCWNETPAGAFEECDCFYRFGYPPCNGCPVNGVCKPSDTGSRTASMGGCMDIGDHCTAIHRQ